MRCSRLRGRGGRGGRGWGERGRGCGVFDMVWAMEGIFVLHSVGVEKREDLAWVLGGLYNISSTN